MRAARIIATIACLAAGSLPANARGHYIHFYFSTQPNNAQVPPEFMARTNPALGPGGGVMYLWAFVEQDTMWSRVSLDIENGTAGPSPMYNPGLGGENQRWHYNSDLDFHPDRHVDAKAAHEWCLGNPIEPLLFPEYSVPGTRHFRVGEIAFAPDFNGAEYLHVGSGGILRYLGTPGVDMIYFGFTPGGEPDGPLYGNQYGAKSDYPDIVPEPGAALLLALGGLVLRRR